MGMFLLIGGWFPDGNVLVDWGLVPSHAQSSSMTAQLPSMTVKKQCILARIEECTTPFPSIVPVGRIVCKTNALLNISQKAYAPFPEWLKFPHTRDSLP